jgi:excisionase family DNA binding protein
VSVAGRIRALVQAAPPDGTVTVAWLAELLEHEAATSEAREDDLTVEDVAAAFGRAVSTVRSWCQAGRIPGAYRLRGREWRIPPAGLDAFRVGEQSGLSAPLARAPSSAAVDLGRWRKLRNVN